MSRFMNNVVKEAFDNLPSGICFFNKNGMVTLCNHQMYRVFFALTGKDLQSLHELQEILNGLADESRGDHDVFLLDDGSSWRFAQEQITAQDGNTYTQVTAFDVTELYRRQKELEEDNKKLKEYAERRRKIEQNKKETLERKARENAAYKPEVLLAWKQALQRGG